MSLIARGAARSARAIHTTARLLNDAPASSSSSGASSTGSALGFSDYSGRTRKLPTLNISATSRQNVLKPRRNDGTPAAAAAAEGGEGSRKGGNRAPQQERRKRQGRSPLQAQQAKIREAQAATATPAGEDDFFDPVTVAATARSRSSGAGLKKVDVDFNPVNVKIPSKGRRGANANANAVNAAEKRSSRTARQARPRPPPVVEVEDRSPEGIFGRASLLFPLRRGAREAESSVWAEGLKPEQARKMELARLAGSPAAYLPQQPMPTELTGKNAAQASKMLSSWLLASNPGVSMRRAKTGEAVIKGYL